MASVEIIGLLCAGSTRYHRAGCSFHGNRLARAELAGLLAGLTAVQMNLTLAKYAGDTDAERLLVAQVRVWAAGLAIRSDWRTVRGRPTICNMSAVAVFDVVRPNRCLRCGGTGTIGCRVCARCNSTGYNGLSGRLIAEAMGVDESCYRRHWRVRYESVLAYVQGLDAEVQRALRWADKESLRVSN